MTDADMQQLFRQAGRRYRRVLTPEEAEAAYDAAEAAPLSDDGVERIVAGVMARAKEGSSDEEGEPT